jgi:hypothetical protein
MKRPGDNTPDPPGGRAAERLRLFEGARRRPSKGEAENLVKPAPRKKGKPSEERSTKHEK